MEADLDDEDEVARLQTRFKKEGIDRALAAQGASPGDEVSIHGKAFEYQPDPVPPTDRAGADDDEERADA
jgi:hypothetical protein